MADKSLLRSIPRVDAILGSPRMAALRGQVPAGQLTDFVRASLARLREEVLSGERDHVAGEDELARDIADDYLARGPHRLRRTINATGVVLHTNLGRAPLGPEVAAHVAEVAQGYSNLEYELGDGARGGRGSCVEGLLRELCGAEDALVVNNNAAAALLMLDTICRGRDVAISRGELVEIGGSFRVPDILARGGACLVEVGTTNKTHPADYERAVAEGAGAILKVHRSNFYMGGFTEEVGLPGLSAIARQAKIPLLFDLGAGLLMPGEALGLPGVPSPRAAIRDGADLVCFSGDKLVGSAQAGIVVGRAELVARLRENPLARALRIDKLSLAALEATLRLSRSRADALGHVPTLRMLSLGREELLARAEALAARVAGELPAFACRVVELEDEAGGGSLPSTLLPGAGVELELAGTPSARLEALLRAAPVPVVCLLRDDRVVLSVRTLQEGDEDEVVRALGRIAGGGAR